MKARKFHLLVLALFICVAAVAAAAEPATKLRGEIVDAATGESLPARLYIESSDGRWFFARTADERGSAVTYSKQASPESIEKHTTLSGHPWTAELSPGKYTFTAERGKEYLPATVTVELNGEPRNVRLELRRWIDMSAIGWFSGETHVHRSGEELPKLMLAEDLNVALPLVYWVTKAHMPPARGDRNAGAAGAELIHVDPTHVIYPLNTEFEIFTIDGRRHTLGAIFALNHKSVLSTGVPPVRSMAEQVHREGGLLELDKHIWPWSMMLVPVAEVDLYELANNHLWRTGFHFRKFGEAPAPFMNIEHNERGMTERGFIDFTFQNYYTLLNCGFRMRPTAGSASGVLPVPLGFARVYVKLADGFSYDAWIEGLDAGRSFVTTGPMLVVELNGRDPGTTFKALSRDAVPWRVRGWAKSGRRLSKIELVAAGRVIRTLTPENRPLAAGGFESPIDVNIPTAEPWLAVRCFEPTADGRLRFAHSAPFHIDVAGAAVRPRPEEIQYLIDRVESQFERNAGVLSDEALDEFRQAAAAYRAIAKSAK